MTWGGNFDTWLTSGETLYPRFVLRAETIPGAPGGSGYFDEGLLGSDGSAAPVSFQAQAVNPQSWQASVGAFTVDIVTNNIGPLLETIRRGTPVSLLMGAPGWDLSAFERVGVGRVTGLSSADAEGTLYRLSCTDVFSLPTRFTTSVANMELFGGTNGAGRSVTLTSGYSIGDSTVEVTTTTGFGRLTGGKYLLKIHPSGGGSPFFLTASSKTGTVFTIDTPLADQYGTVRADASSGDTVTSACLLRGHPLDIVRTILTTTGNGTNGTYDLGEAAWGLSLPDALVDHFDIEQQKAFLSFPSSDYEWSLIVESEWLSGYTVLSAALAEAGLFLTIHEGQITCRAAQSLHDPGVGPFYSIGAQDIDTKRTVRWEAWDSSVAYEYDGVVVNGPTNADGTITATATVGPGGNTTSTAPALQGLRAPRTLNYAWHLTSQVCTEVGNRLMPWHASVPERLSVPLAGVHHHRLSLGQLVRFSHPTIRSRRTGEPFDRQIGCVVRQAPDWSSGPTIDLAFLPLPNSSQG